MDPLSLSDPLIVAVGVTLGKTPRGFSTHEAQRFKYSWINGVFRLLRVTVYQTGNLDVHLHFFS